MNITPFIEYINEADKSRFVKKNKNLSSRQQQRLIDWLADHKHAEKAFLRKNNNDPKVFTTMSSYDAEALMASETPTSKKKKMKALRHKGISGLKEGKDYIHVKIRNKMFLVYIPLHYKAAQIIMSVHIGECTHKGCIGSSQAEHYYKSEAKDPSYIPIIVIGNGEKYAVMMYPDNRSWEIWYHTNRPQDVRYDEGIPNFSIKQELVGSKKSDLYDEIREDLWNSKEEAIKSYEHLANDISQYLENYMDYMRYGIEEVKDIVDDTIQKYRELADDVMDDFKKEEKELKYNLPHDEVNKRENMLDRINALKYMLKNNPEGTDTDEDGNPLWYVSSMEKPAKRSQHKYLNVDATSVNTAYSVGVPYTKKELIRYIKFAEDNYLKSIPKKGEIDLGYIEEKRKEAEAEAKEYLDVAKKLQELKKDPDDFEMVYSEKRYDISRWEWLDDVKFTRYLPDHPDDYPRERTEFNLREEAYKSYEDYNNRHGNGYELEDLEDAINELPYHYDYTDFTSNSFDGMDFLRDEGFKHPEDIKE